MSAKMKTVIGMVLGGLFSLFLSSIPVFSGTDSKYYLGAATGILIVTGLLFWMAINVKENLGRQSSSATKAKEAKLGPIAAILMALFIVFGVPGLDNIQGDTADFFIGFSMGFFTIMAFGGAYIIYRYIPEEYYESDERDTS